MTGTQLALDIPLPKQQDGEHNALADARHNLEVGRYLERIAAQP